VVILCLPPNTTHLIQPLDISVFAPIKTAWKAILKQYKLETRGQRVSKEVFPSLIKKLWDAAFKPDHCKGGFRRAGIIPFSREHVLEKLPPPVFADSADSANHSNDNAEVVKATTRLSCAKCGHVVPTTPIVKTHIVSFFAGILEVRREGPKRGERNNLKIRVEGEAITSDEFMDLLREEKAKKEAEAAERKKPGKKKQQNHSQAMGKCSYLVGPEPLL